MLSDRQIRSLNYPNRLYADGGGLYLRISEHGTKTFLFRTRKGGKARYVTLGTYPSLSLKTARSRVFELQGASLDHTVAYAVEEYLKSLKYLRGDEVERRLRKDIIPSIGHLKLSAVAASDISSALHSIVERGSPVSANRTLADVRHVFDYAYGKGWINSDPSLRITRKVIGGKEQSREYVLSGDELKHLIKELRTTRWEVKTRAALALCLLTGQRASEVLGIRGEVSGSWWTIPKHRTKSKRSDQKVYLVPLARYFARHVTTCDHRTLSRALNRAGYPFTQHDLRRTMATKMSDLGIPPHVVEKCLHHQMEGAMAVYNRAEYLQERTEAWKLWYAFLRRIIEPPWV